MKTPFRADDTALLLIDHQVGTMQLIKNLPLDVVKRTAWPWPKRPRSWACPWC
jgi:hypothetical protein